MRKNVFGRQLKRDVNERKALFKGLLSSLVLVERINTTEEKAKSIKGSADRIITLAKRGNSTQILQQYLIPEAIKKVTTELVLRFDKRNGGYTRLIHVGRRLSDNASMVMMEWVEQAKQFEASVGQETKQQKADKKAKAKSSALKVKESKKDESTGIEKKKVVRSSKTAVQKKDKNDK